MKRIIYILAAVFLAAGFSSCSGTKDAGVDISGQWHLVETGDLIEGQGLDIDVYASFSSGTFALYQKVGSGLVRYWYYEGSYSVSDDNVLTGRYSDGTRLGGTRGLGYAVDLSGSQLTLTSLASGEVSVYEQAEIPADVIGNAVPPVRSGDAVALPVL